MRVTRITIDADLGLIELQTGPGGDGNYVLLPLEVSESLQRYVTLAGEKCEAEAPAYSGMRETEEEARSEGSIVAAGGWYVPADQAYDYNLTPGVGAYAAVTENPIQVERGGYTYPTKLQKDFDKYLAADKDECDGNCGAHPVKKGRDDDEWTRAPGEGDPSKERHTGPATIANPIRVFADEHSRGYRLHSPALPGWRADINQYDLYKVPGLIREALVDMGSDHAINYPVTITVMEEDQ